MDWEAFYARFRTPDFVPGYAIENRLGGGAFGEVYKARKHSIGKPFAIKFLKVDDDSQREAVERELEQVRRFAAIDHPNLVTIEDLGTVMGVPFLIMGYAGEETLARLMRAQRLEPERALSYFVQACRGVHALHERRLVHFDLKPSNVFLKGDVARVGDYGLSKMVGDGRLTLSFGRGTPQYMAPEMIKNRADHRADIYSLGVILYESLTGKLPFESAVPGTLALREDDAPPPFPPGFPAEARRVVERCLRLAPSDRYASVSELLAELGESVRGGDPLRAVHGPARAAAAPPTPAASSSARAAAEPARGGEARQAAAELTRGAVEVARGVWDGIVTASSRAPRPPPAPSAVAGAPAAAGHGAQTAGAQTAASAPVPAGPSDAADARAAPPAAPAPSWDADGVTIHTLSSGSRAAPSATGSGILVPATPVAASAPGAAPLGSTIPVPPAVEGGWLATLGATLQLSTEVLVSMLRGLGGWAVTGIRTRRARRAARPAQRGVRRFLGGLLRLLVFCLMLGLLGAIAASVALLFFARGA